ncbi:hypothetical protein PWT90_10575 [Aphanocladium album]|nr:hypothetical protein PWT90_10575 [Aphanocladium album]
MSDTLTSDNNTTTSDATSSSRRQSATMLKMVTPQDIRSPGPDMSPRTRALPDYFAVGALKSELASIQEQEAPSYQLNGYSTGRRESTISFQDELPTRRSSNGTDGGNSISLGRKLSTSSVSSRRPRYSASLHGLELQEHAARIRASSPPPERWRASRLGMQIVPFPPRSHVFVSVSFAHKHAFLGACVDETRKYGTGIVQSRQAETLASRRECARPLDQEVVHLVHDGLSWVKIECSGKGGDRGAHAESGVNGAEHTRNAEMQALRAMRAMRAVPVVDLPREA